MHQLQPKHLKIKAEEAKEIFDKYKISTSQLPSIKSTDKALPKEAKLGDVIKIERKSGDGEKTFYYRVVVR